MKNIIFKDDQSAFQLFRLLGEAVYEASDIGEVISTAEKIEEGNYTGWCEEWRKVAERIHKSAEESYSQGHRISARKAYLRAANYYRTAEFYMHENPDDPNIEALYDLSFQCFSKVMKQNTPVIDYLVSRPEIDAKKLFYRGKV